MLWYRTSGSAPTTIQDACLLPLFSKFILPPFCRFELDACILNEPEADLRRTAAQDSAPDDIDVLTAGLQNLTTTEDAPITPATDANLHVLRAGTLGLVPQTSLAEMTTRGTKHLRRDSESEGSGEIMFDWAEYFPQLFLAQVPHHILGEHQSGRFLRVYQRILRDEILALEQQKMQPAFNKLLRVLELIRDTAQVLGEDRKLALVHRNGKVEIFERQDQSSCLPDRWRRKFDAPQTEVEEAEIVESDKTDDIGTPSPPTSQSQESEALEPKDSQTELEIKWAEDKEGELEHA